MSKLFSSFSLRTLELGNRIVVSPMAQYSAENGEARDWHLVHYGSLAVSGAGLLVLEATAVEPRGRVGPRCLGLWTDKQAEALIPILDFCRNHGGARLGIQLAHAGRKASVSVPWEKQLPIAPDSGGWQTIGPSEIPYGDRLPPAALTRDDMHQLVDAYINATRRANRVGFDLIELHAAHGYLLHSFLSPLSNQRLDQYGGSLENRMRFPLELFESIREVWPTDRPLGVRISATDWAEGGWTLGDSLVLAQRLRERGCDYIACSSGGTTREQKITVRPGYQVPFAETIRREADIATIAVGLVTDPLHAEEIVSTGAADLVALGRGIMYNPRWAWHAAEVLGGKAYFPPQYARSHPSMRDSDPLKPYREAS